MRENCNQVADVSPFWGLEKLSPKVLSKIAMAHFAFLNLKGRNKKLIFSKSDSKNNLLKQSSGMKIREY